MHSPFSETFRGLLLLRPSFSTSTFTNIKLDQPLASERSDDFSPPRSNLSHFVQPDFGVRSFILCNLTVSSPPARSNYCDTSLLRSTKRSRQVSTRLVHVSNLVLPGFRSNRPFRRLALDESAIEENGGRGGFGYQCEKAI